MKKILFLLLVLMQSIAMSAQVTLTVNLKDGDDFEKIFTDQDMPFEVTDMKITGFFNHKNFYVLYKLANVHSLKYVDMSECEVEDNTIPAYALDNAFKLETFLMPKNVEVIGECAFRSSKLTRIELPQTIKELGKAAFDGTDAWGTLTVPETITDLADELFSGNNFSEVILPSGLKRIGKRTFSSLKYLETITLPQGLETIDNRAFFGSGLKTVEIPSSVKQLNKEAYYLCESLNKVIINEGLEQIGVCAFASCKNLESISFPSSVKEIGDSAFVNNENLKIVVLPENLCIIGAGAFNLDEDRPGAFYGQHQDAVYSKNPVPPLMSKYINGEAPVALPFTPETYNNATLYVPVGAKAAYEAAFGWNEFKSIVETDNFPSGIDVIQTEGKAGVKVVGMDGGIAIGDGTGRMAYTVYGADGRMVAAGTANGRTVVNLPQGVYMVKTADGTARVMAK